MSKEGICGRGRQRLAEWPLVRADLQLLWVAEVAALLACSADHVYRHIRMGHISVVYVGRSVRVPRAAVERLSVREDGSGPMEVQVADHPLGERCWRDACELRKWVEARAMQGPPWVARESLQAVDAYRRALLLLGLAPGWDGSTLEFEHRLRGVGR